MAIHPDTHERITKLQKDVEQIKEELEDQWHEKRAAYEERVSRALAGNQNAATLYLEIDGLRSISEIEKDLITQQRRIPHNTLYLASLRLLRNGLIRKVGIKKKSPVYAKKPWAIALDLDSYVRVNILQQKE